MLTLDCQVFSRKHSENLDSPTVAFYVRFNGIINKKHVQLTQFDETQSLRCLSSFEQLYLDFHDSRLIR